MLLQQFKKVLKPGKVLVIDESMIPWRGRLRFRQYIKNKSHKYGVKLCKSCTPEGYTYNIIIYTGKEDGGQEVNHATKVVLKLIKDLENEGRIVVVDNFYTSIGLAEALLSKKTFICGTLRANRRGLPKKVVSTKLKKGQIEGKMNKKGVRVIKWVDKRPVLMMTTCKNHDTTIIDTGRTRRSTNESIKKPECVLSYNNYKKGIDYSDQMSSYYSTLKKGLKWYRKVMMELIFGTALINAWIVYNLKNETKMTKLQFTERIIEKFTKVPLKINPGIPTTTIASTTTNSEEDKTGHNFKKGDKKRNCSGCYDKLRETLSSKDAANKVKKVITYCNECKKTLCRECYNQKHVSSSR